MPHLQLRHKYTAPSVRKNIHAGEKNRTINLKLVMLLPFIPTFTFFPNMQQILHPQFISQKTEAIKTSMKSHITTIPHSYECCLVSCCVPR